MFIRKKSNNIINNKKPYNTVLKHDKKVVVEDNKPKSENVVKEEYLEEALKPIRSKAKKTAEEKE